MAWKAWMVSVVLLGGAAAVAGPASAEAGCKIEGLVLDEALAPLPGARVTADSSPPRQDTTGPDGRFVLRNVEAGTRALTTTKDGFIPSTKAVACAAGGATDVIFVLRAEPVPFMVIFAPENGKIGCSVGFLSISTSDLCKDFGISPDARTIIRLGPPTDPIHGAVYEREWAATSALGGKYLSMTYPPMKARQPQITVGPNNKLKVGSIVTGTSPLQLRAEAIDASDPLYHFTSQNR